MGEFKCSVDSFTTQPALIVDRDGISTTQKLSEHLQKEMLSYQAVYLSADQAGISILHCVSEVRKRFPLSPIYFVFGDTTDEPLQAVELRRLGIRDLVRRGEIGQKVRERQQSYLELAPKLAAALEKRSKKVAQGASIPVPIQVPGYRPVLAEDMLSGEVSLFDVHLLLSSQKRIKIFAANDAFDVGRVLKYISEGIHWVYVKEASVQTCLQYTEFLTENLVRSLHASDETKFLHIANMANLVLTQYFDVRTPNFTNLLQEVGGVSEKIQQLLMTVKSDPARMARVLFTHADQLHHAFSVAWISGLLALAMKMNSPKTLDKLTFAALFHDVGWLALSIDVRFGLNGETNEGADQAHVHCEAGVQLLSALGISDASILQAVSQHHQKWGEGEVHLFAELIRISDGLTWVLKNAKDGDRSKILADFRMNQNNQFSLSVLEGFDAVFS